MHHPIETANGRGWQLSSNEKRCRVHGNTGGHRNGSNPLDDDWKGSSEDTGLRQKLRIYDFAGRSVKTVLGFRVHLSPGRLNSQVLRFIDLSESCAESSTRLNHMLNHLEARILGHPLSVRCVH